MNDLPKSVRWESGELYILDQTQLPFSIVEEKQETVQQVWNAIKTLKVRGAPAIGIAGAYGLVVAAKSCLDLPADAFIQELERHAAYLDTARPTAVNLSWALNRMVEKVRASSGQSTKDIFKILVQEAKDIHEEDRQICREIGEYGLPLIREGMGVLTHCNAGAMAVSELGTATAPLYLAHARGVRFRVYADETRPVLQGARLTTWELRQSGIDVTLICDNMVAYMMDQGLIDLVIVGTDRVAANGDVANKIGTLGVAILAHYFSIPFYVACPSSTIDLATSTGDDIKIEERGREEVVHFGCKKTALDDVKVRNPAFDITTHRLITGIITDRGIIYPSYTENLQIFAG